MAKGISNSCIEDYISFDRLIDLQTPVTSRDAFGGEVITWTHEIIPSAITPVQNKSESLGTSLKKHALTTITFTIRYRSMLYEKQQITFEGNDYDILGITEVPRRKYTEITAVLIR